MKHSGSVEFLGKHEKTQTAVLSGRSDANIAFADLLSLLDRLGFTLRVKGDHHILTKEGGGGDHQSPNHKTHGKALPSETSARHTHQIPHRS